ncbi:unnamed protein product, partial [Ceratitis capitata]
KFLDEMFYRKDDKSSKSLEVDFDIQKEESFVDSEEIIEQSSSESENEISEPIVPKRSRGRPKIIRSGARGRPKKSLQEGTTKRLDNELESTVVVLFKKL